jgi:hypothetical protein
MAPLHGCARMRRGLTAERRGDGYFVAPETRPWPEVYHLQLAAVGAAGATAAAE